METENQIQQQSENTELTQNKQDLTQEEQQQKSEQKQLNNNKDQNEDLEKITTHFTTEINQLMEQLEQENPKTIIVSESLLKLKQYYNQVAYCLTQYHLGYFKKLMRQVGNKLEQIKEQKRGKKVFSFESKFKFKTLHLNQKVSNKENVAEDVKEQVVEQKFQIDSYSDQTSKNIVLDDSQVKDHYKLSNLTDCNVIIKAKLQTLYLENLNNCVIDCGLVETSVFGSFINNSTIKCIAQQIRIHKTKNTTFQIYVTSSMIIEDCSDLKIGEFKDIDETNAQHLKTSILNNRSNNWQQIKDFNWIKKTKSPHYDLI